MLNQNVILNPEYYNIIDITTQCVTGWSKTRGREGEGVGVVKSDNKASNLSHINYQEVVECYQLQLSLEYQSNRFE